MLKCNHYYQNIINNHLKLSNSPYSGAENGRLSWLFSFDPNWILYVCVSIIIPCDIEHATLRVTIVKRKFGSKLKEQGSIR